MTQLPKLPRMYNSGKLHFSAKHAEMQEPKRREPVSLTAGGSAYATRRRWVASSLTLRGF
jgi:hypothetical protein